MRDARRIDRVALSSTQTVYLISKDLAATRWLIFPISSKHLRRWMLSVHSSPRKSCVRPYADCLQLAGQPSVRGFVQNGFSITSPGLRQPLGKARARPASKCGPKLPGTYPRLHTATWSLRLPAVHNACEASFRSSLERDFATALTVSMRSPGDRFEVAFYKMTALSRVGRSLFEV